jgi:hypothetical protein
MYGPANNWPSDEIARICYGRPWFVREFTIAFLQCEILSLAMTFHVTRFITSAQDNAILFFKFLIDSQNT